MSLCIKIVYHLFFLIFFFYFVNVCCLGYVFSQIRCFLSFVNVCCYVLALNRAVWYVHPVHVFAPKGVKDKKKTRTKEERAALVAEMLGGKIQTVLKKAMSAT